MTHDILPSDNRKFDGSYLFTGQPTELWQYGEETEAIMLSALATRERLRPYISKLYAQASEDGSSLSRALFYE